MTKYDWYEGYEEADFLIGKMEAKKEYSRFDLAGWLREFNKIKSGGVLLAPIVQAAMEEPKRC